MTIVNSAVRRVVSVAVQAATALVLLGVAQTQALSIGSAELHAAKGLGCVLAEDALGYLTEDQFNERFDETVAGLSAEQEDVAYATALGYIDGLLFGVGSGNEAAAMERLQALSESESCSRFMAVRSDSVSL